MICAISITQECRRYNSDLHQVFTFNFTNKKLPDFHVYTAQMHIVREQNISEAYITTILLLLKLFLSKHNQPKTVSILPVCDQRELQDSILAKE